MVKVVILGCGPAGLFAAHAAASLGHDIVIYSRKRKSELHGAQYLHRNIPGITQESPEFSVWYQLQGTAEGYAKKVYGEVPPDFVSPTRLLGEQPAWDIREAYDRAWKLYSGEVINVEPITPHDIERALYPGGILRDAQVISTIPATQICKRTGEHTFAYREAWAIGDAPERGIECPVSVIADSVVCDGTSDVGWYRASNINGYRTAEWPEVSRPPISDVALIKKVVRTNCNCWGVDGFWRAGRYGAWDKSLLTHHAYWIILEALKAIESRDRHAK